MPIPVPRVDGASHQVDGEGDGQEGVNRQQDGVVDGPGVGVPIDKRRDGVEQESDDVDGGYDPEDLSHVAVANHPLEIQEIQFKLLPFSSPLLSIYFVVSVNITHRWSTDAT